MGRFPRPVYSLVLGIGVTGFMFVLAATFLRQSSGTGRAGVAYLAAIYGACAVGVAVLSAFEGGDRKRAARMRWNRRQRVAKAQRELRRVSRDADPTRDRHQDGER